MYVKRIYPNDEIQAAIIAAARDFYEKLDLKVGQYGDRLVAMPKVINTKRVIREEIFV
jgi:hypothetical protein